MNYAIFRSNPIYTVDEFDKIGLYIKRKNNEKNVEFVSIRHSLVKDFMFCIKKYEKEHEERMKQERNDRKRTFIEMLNKSKSVVADELLFTATPKFFSEMNLDNIINWGNICMDFIYKDLGYERKQILYSGLFLCNDVPQLYCIVVPIVRKFDKRTRTKRYTISKKEYIKDKYHLSELQDKYYQRLVDNGYKLNRGIKKLIYQEGLNI